MEVGERKSGRRNSRLAHSQYRWGHLATNANNFTVASTVAHNGSIGCAGPCALKSLYSAAPHRDHQTHVGYISQFTLHLLNYSYILLTARARNRLCARYGPSSPYMSSADLVRPFVIYFTSQKQATTHGHEVSARYHKILTQRTREPRT